MGFDSDLASSIGGENDDAIDAPSSPGPAFRSASMYSGAGTTSGSLAVPAGVASGDVMLAALYFSDDTPITYSAPAGWNLVVDRGTVERFVVWWRVATSAEPPAYSWSFTCSGGCLSGDMAGGISSYAGANPTQPFLATQSNADGCSSANKQITATSPGPITGAPFRLISIFQSEGSGAARTTWSDPAGTTRRFQVDGDGKQSLLFVDEAIQSATDPGFRTARIDAAPMDDYFFSCNAAMLALGS